MATYASMDLIRSICGISTTELSDDEMSGLLSMAVGLFNGEVNIEVGVGVQEFELLTPDPNDTSNTKFYTSKFPLADSDGDASIGTGDISVYDDLKQNGPTSIDVASIADYKTGHIVLAAATTDQRFATYHYTSIPYESQSFKLAFCYYASMLIWDRLMATVESMSMGGMSVTRRNYFKDRWEQARSKLLGAAMFSMVDSSVRMDRDSDYFEDPDAEEG